MCIAMVVKMGSSIDVNVLDVCAINNDDGAGYAFVLNGAIKVVKSVKWEHIRKQFKQDARRHSHESPFLIHFRLASHGAVETANCHPFPVQDGAMIHNGMFPFCDDRKVSDTAEFARMITEQWRDGWQDNLMNCKFIEEGIGTGNKVAFLWPDKTYTILNELKGGAHWKGDVWFSNYSYNKKSTGNWKPIQPQTTWSQGKVWDQEKKCYVDKPAAPEVDKSTTAIVAHQPIAYDEWDEDDYGWPRKQAPVSSLPAPGRDTERVQPPVAMARVERLGQEIKEILAEADKVEAKRPVNVPKVTCGVCGSDLSTKWKYDAHTADICMLAAKYGRPTLPTGFSTRQLSLDELSRRRRGIVDRGDGKVTVPYPNV